MALNIPPHQTVPMRPDVLQPQLQQGEPPVLTAARAYTQRGWHVLPLPSGEKSPGRKGWQRERHHERDLPSLFQRGANIGILTGEPSGWLVDVDCDVPEALDAADVFLPKTARIHGRPGSPRSHRWYVAPMAKYEAFSFPENGADAAKATMYIELRSSGHQTIVPPSVADGEQRQWDARGDPAQVDAQTLRGAVAKCAACALLARHWPAQGTRDSAAMALAGLLLRGGWEPDDVDEFVTTVARLAGDEEWQTRNKARQTARKIADGQPATGATALKGYLRDGSLVVAKVRAWLNILSLDEGASERQDSTAERAPTGTAGQVDNAPEGEVALPSEDAEDVATFPLVVLPAALRDLVEVGAKAIHCPPDFLAVPLLVALGVAIGTTRAIEIKPGWHEYARLWAAIVAKPGDKKSPALDLVTQSLHERQRSLASEYSEAKQAYDRDRDKDAHEQPPTMQQIMTTDATIEALADLLQANPRGVLLHRDELTGWALAMGQYKASKSADRANWLSLWNGAPIIVNRRSRGTALFVDKPFVGVVGAIQPDVLNDLADERGREDGFIHRILFSYPQPMPRKWTDASVAPEVLTAARDVFDRLWNLQSAVSSESVSGPVVLPFTHDAKQLWREWITDHYDAQEAPEFPDSLRGPWAKLEGYTARFALIIQMARVACGEADASHHEIDATSMTAAAELADYFKSHARRVYVYLHTTPEDKRVLSALVWIRRQAGQSVTAREALHAHLGGVKTSDEAKRLLCDLAERGYGEVKETKATRGPAGLRFTLYPRDSRQNAQSRNQSDAEVYA